MRLLRLSLVALVLAAGLAAPTLMSANADHANQGYGHWYHQGTNYSAPPIFDRNVTMRGGVSLFADAATYWRGQSNGTINPYLGSTGGNPYDCSHRDWTIVVCIADLGYNQVMGETSGYAYDGTHIMWKVIKINWRKIGGFTDEELIRAVRHELGHALGLGHTILCCSSVMVAAPASRYANQHDRDVLWQLYGAHAH